MSLRNAKMKLKAGTFGVRAACGLIFEAGRHVRLYSGRAAPSPRDGRQRERLRLNALSSEVRRPSSSIDTHRFIANGCDVRDRICAITSVMAAGRGCAHRTIRVRHSWRPLPSVCEDSPPSGPWMMGYSIPSFAVKPAPIHGFMSWSSPSSVRTSSEPRGTLPSRSAMRA